MHEARRDSTLATMQDARPSRRRAGPLTAFERSHLWWALPPLCVLLIANMLFELVGRGYSMVATDLLLTEADASGQSRTAISAAAGLNWAAVALVYLCISIGAAIGAVRIIVSRVEGRARRPFVLFALGVTAVGMLHLAAIDIGHLPLRALFAVTYEALLASPSVHKTQAEAIGSVVAAINVMSVVVPALILTAAGASALPPVRGWNETTLARRSLQVRRIVVIAAAFMVAGVLHMGAWTHWAGATLPTAAGDALDQVAAPLTLFWGATYTLMIASFYIPMSVRLGELAETVMDEDGIAVSDRPQWLVDRGLSFRLSEQLPQLAAIAAPLLASPVSEAVSAFSDTLVR